MEDTLVESRVTAITGTAAEVLALISKERTSGFFAEAIPLTDSEIGIIKGLHGEKRVKDMLDTSFNHCIKIAYKLGGIQ